ncbi:MAG TPA: hypothetical protein VG929_06400 [Actinomycetota bacterium]|nr:hypothetical protein [Actinomycetota bacterium]
MRKRRIFAALFLTATAVLLPACGGDGDDRDIIEDPRGGNEEGPGEDVNIGETPTNDS